MARLTGKAGGAVLGSALAEVTGWEYEATSTNVEPTAAGDVATERAHIRTDYRATIRLLVNATPPYNVHTDLVGTEVAFELKILAADANGIVEDTGLVTSARIVHNHDAATELEVEVVSSDGSANPSYDESPAT